MRALGVSMFLAAFVGCSFGVQSPVTHQPRFDSVRRVVAGEVPESPEAAQAWLDEATQDVRELKRKANLVCVGLAVTSENQYPKACLNLDAWYSANAVPLRAEIQGFVDQWRSDGGELNKSATKYFRDKIASRIPQLESLLAALAGFGDVSGEPPLLPEL